MNFEELLSAIGIVSKDDVQFCVCTAKRRNGKTPDGTTWNEKRLYREARAVLRKSSLRDAPNRLVERIRARPSSFIIGWSSVIAKALTTELRFICKRDLGDGWDVDSKACLTWLVELLEAEPIKPEDAFSRFVGIVGKTPHLYLIPDATAAEAMAHTIYKALKDSLDGACPQGFDVAQAEVEARIKPMVLQRISRDDVIKRLIKMIRANPYTFFRQIDRSPWSSLSRSGGGVDYAQSPRVSRRGPFG